MHAQKRPAGTNPHPVALQALNGSSRRERSRPDESARSPIPRFANLPLFAIPLPSVKREITRTVNSSPMRLATVGCATS